MGQLCSCHREQKGWSSGKAISQDYLLSRPISRSNGYGPHSDCYGESGNTGNDVMPPYAGLTSSRTSCVTAARSSSLKILGYSQHRKVEHSYSTIDPESGFSSKASSSFDNANQSSSSAPSTPETMIRRKPPPKPPRMRTSTDTLLRTPTASLRSAGGVRTLKSSIVDVTNALDGGGALPTFSGGEASPTTDPDIRVTDGADPAREKVISILDQTKEFLAFELQPDAVLSYLVEKGAVGRQDADNIRACLTAQARSELLIDVITSKGRREFGTFCAGLRGPANLGYLADFLEVLDALVELATDNSIMKPIDRSSAAGSPNLRVRAFSFEVDRKSNVCSCSTSNNNNCKAEGGDDEAMTSFTDDASFDVDISYVNRETNETRSIREVAAMKRRRRPLTAGGGGADDGGRLGALLLEEEEADRYVPVISASLYNRCLKHGGIDVIARLLAEYSCIRDLSLVKNHLNADSMRTLSRSLERNRGLAKLDIRLNQIGDAGAAHLSRAISGHRSLRTLKLTSTGLGGLGCARVVMGAANSPRLAELDIGFNDMSESACETLGRCLAGNPSLRRLRLRGNGVTAYGARCVFRGLRRNCRVKYLDVSRNRIRDESLAALCELLLANRTLAEVNLENCALSGQGCRALSRALKTNTSLRCLDLSMNDIGDAGAAALADGLKYNKALETLCLNMCAIGNGGFLLMLDALRHNTTISTLKLCYNYIGKRDGVEPIAELPDIRPASALGTEVAIGDATVALPTSATASSTTTAAAATPRRSQSLIEKTCTSGPTHAPRPHQRNMSASFGDDRNVYVNSAEVRTARANVGRPTSLPLAVESTNVVADRSPRDPVDFAPMTSSSPAPSPTGTACSFASVPQSFLASPDSSSHQVSLPSPLSPPATPGLSPTTTWPPGLSPTLSPPLSPRSPVIASLRQSFTGACAPGASSLDRMYETLCDVLQQNKDLKVLLWGNNFDEGQEVDGTPDNATSSVQLQST